MKIKPLTQENLEYYNELIKKYSDGKDIAPLKMVAMQGNTLYISKFPDDSYNENTEQEN